MSDLVRVSRAQEPIRIEAVSQTSWGGEPPRDEIDGRQVLGMLRRNMLLIALCTIGPVAVAAYLTSRAVPQYEAAVVLRVDEQQTGIPALDILRSRSGVTEINTEREILGSRTVAEQVVDALKLQLRVVTPGGVSRDSILTGIALDGELVPGRYRLVRQSGDAFAVRDTTGATRATLSIGEPVALAGMRFMLTPAAAAHEVIELRSVSTDAAVEELRSAVTVSRPSREVRTLQLRYRGTDPTLVRDVPNAFAARFVASRQETKQASARSTVAFLREQIQTIGPALGEAEETLRAFRERERVVSVSDQARTEVSRVAELQAQRSALEMERSALARLVADARAAAARHQPNEPSPYRTLLAFPTLLRNQAASQLFGSLTSLEDRRAELLTRRSMQDPDVQVLTQRISEVEDQLRSVAETYLQGISDQVASTETYLSQSMRQLGAIPTKEAEFARLHREARTLEEIYTLLQTRLKESEIAAAAEDGSVGVIDYAVMPRRPVEPKPARTLSFALAFGVLFGVAAAFAREWADKSVHTRRHVQDITGRPVIGLVPRVHYATPWRSRLRLGSGGTRGNAVRKTNGATRPRQVTGHAAAAATRTEEAWSATKEAFSRLHANLTFGTESGGVARTMIVTSPLPGDGKTTVAVSLASTIARHGERVLLIDSDLRKGVVHQVFGLSRAPGLSDVLLGRTEAWQAVREVAVDGEKPLHVLCAGRPSTNPLHVLGPARMHALLQNLTEEFDWIIVDSPPLNVVADAALLGATGTGVILVARAGVTPTEALGFAVEQLQSVRANVIGTVLNDLGKRESSYDSAYRYYEYTASYHDARAE